MVKKIKQKKELILTRKLRFDENGFITGWSTVKKIKNPINMTDTFPLDFPGFKMIEEQELKDEYKNLQWKVENEEFIKYPKNPTQEQIEKKEKKDFNIDEKIKCLVDGIMNGKDSSKFQKLYNHYKEEL